MPRLTPRTRDARRHTVVFHNVFCDTRLTVRAPAYPAQVTTRPMPIDTPYQARLDSSVRAGQRRE